MAQARLEAGPSEGRAAVPRREPTPVLAEPERAKRWHLGPEVFLIVQDDVARVLDLERGRFFALDAIGAQMLGLALDVGEAEAVRRLAERYGVPAERVRTDLANLFRDLRAQRLVTVAATGVRPAPVPPAAAVPTARPRPERPPLPRRARLPGRLTIGLMLAAAWICLRLLGWARTVRLWRPRPLASNEGRDPAETVRAVDAAVRDAAAVHPLNPQCKERALVGWRLLRDTGRLAAELVVGVNLYPFRLHAWVECGPWTVTDDDARCSEYLPVVRYS